MITAIIVNNTFLVVPPDTIPGLKDSSQLFSYSGVPGKWTLPFTIPYKENAVTLGYPAEPTVIDNSVEMDCTLIINESWLIKGTLVVLKASYANIEVSVGSPYFDVTEELNNTSIKELDWEPVQMSASDVFVIVDITFTSPSALADTITLHSGYAEYTYLRTLGEPLVAVIGAFVDFIMADLELSGIHAEIIGGDILRLRQNTAGGINRAFDTTLLTASSAGLTITFTYDFVTWLTDWHDELTTYLGGHRDEFYPDLDFTFPMHKNANHYGDLNADFTGWINVFVTSDAFINYSSTETFTGNKYTLVPMVFALTVMKKIFEQSNIELVIAADLLEKLKRLIIDNNYSIGKEWYDPVDDIEYLAFDDRVYIPNHLPDMTCGEFNDAIRQKGNFYFDYDPLLRKVELKIRDKVIENPVKKDWMMKPQRDLPIFEFERPKGVKFTSPQDGSDDESGKYYCADDATVVQQADYIIGDGELEIVSAFSHPSMAFEDHPITSPLNSRYPRKLQTGSGEEWGGRGSSFAPRLLIYYGTEFSDTEYPFASNDNYDYTGLVDTEIGISLIWKDTYAIFWPLWIAFILSNSQCRATLLVTEENLMKSDFFTWVGYLHANWLIDTWEIVDVTENGIYVEVLMRKSSAINI